MEGGSRGVVCREAGLAIGSREVLRKRAADTTFRVKTNRPPSSTIRPRSPANFEPVCPRRLARGADENARRSIAKFKISGDFILDFDGVTPANPAERADSFRHAAHPLQKIEMVRILVHQDAAAFAFPCSTPAGRRIIRIRPEPFGHHEMDTLKFAQFAARDRVPNPHMPRVGPQVEHDREDLFPALVRGNQPLRFGLMARERFFDQHVKALAESVDADFRMEQIAAWQSEPHRPRRSGSVLCSKQKRPLAA